MKTDKRVSQTVLQKLVPMKDLELEIIEDLSLSTYFEMHAADEYLFTAGSSDPWAIYLLSGEINLIRPDIEDEKLVGGSEQAKFPVAHSKPRQYTAIAKSSVIFFRIKASIINKLLENTPHGGGLDMSREEDSVESQIISVIDKDLKVDKLIIPSLPDVALKVREAIQDPKNDTDKIAKLIQTDPALAGRIIQVSNSPIYRGQSTINSCRAAVSRMGLKVTRDLVMSAALQQLFESDSSVLKQLMEQLWHKSTFVAALSSILARLEPKLDADRALLAGLVHNIGALPIVAYAESYPQLAEEPELLNNIITKKGCKIGEMILRRWKFENELVTVVSEAHDWFRESGSSVDYCDIVQLAQLYSYIDTPEMVNYPTVDQIPAFKKLPLGRLGPNMTIKVLETAQADIEEIQKMLAG